MNHKTLMSSVFIALTPIAYATLPVIMSAPSPAIPYSIDVGADNNYEYTITNNVPVELPLSISGLSNPVNRTTVFGDCGNTLPAQSTCNIGIQIAPTSSQAGQSINQTLSINYQGRTPLTSAIDFTVTSIPSTTMLLSVGSSYDNGDVPLFIQSINGGSDWVPKALSGFNHRGALFNTSCTGSGVSRFCIASGIDETVHSPRYGLLIAQTNNNGSIWSPVSVDVETGAIPYSQQASCAGGSSNYCVVIATELTADSWSAQTVPYLTETTNSGAMWSSPNLPDYGGSNGIAYLDAVSCTGADANIECVALGGNASGAPYYIYKSGLNDWTAGTALGGISSAFKDYGLGCAGSGNSAVCIDAGQVNGSGAPIFIQTQDGGQNWSLPNLTFSLPSAGFFNSASCTQGKDHIICAAVGQDLSQNSPTPPLLVYSIDGATNWNLFTFAGGIDNGFLSAVSCSGDRCIAVGQNSANSTPYMIEGIYDSTAQKMSWSPIDLSNVLGNMGGYFNSASCNGTGTSATCQALGKDNDDDLAFIIQSRDGGSTWAKAPIPSNPTRGTLLSSVISN